MAALDRDVLACPAAVPDYADQPTSCEDESLSFFTEHLRRHHNPSLHVIAAVCAAGGALFCVGEGYLVFTVFLALLSVLNIVHAVAEHRRPDYRQQWAKEHMQMLRLAVQELEATDDEDS